MFYFYFGGIILDREGLWVYTVAGAIKTVKESLCNSHVPNFQKELILKKCLDLFYFDFGGIIIDREGLWVYTVAGAIKIVKESLCNSHVPNFQKELI